MSEVIDMLRVPFSDRPPEQLIAWRGQQAVSHLQFQQQVAAWHAFLQQHPGRKFALYSNDSVAFAGILFGAWQAGKTIVLPGDMLPATCRALSLEVDAYLGDFDAAWSPLSLPLSQELPADTPSLNALDPDLIGLVVHTSGSTGTPRAIPKKLAQLAAEVASLENLFGDQLGSADVIATVSHQHIYGLLFKVLWPLSAGRAMHAEQILFPEELAAALSRRNCLLVASPAQLKRFPDSPVAFDNTHLRAVFSSGGPLSLASAQTSAQRFGCVPIEIYGSSETGGIAWRQRAGVPVVDESWQAMPGVCFRIVDDSKQSDPNTDTGTDTDPANSGTLEISSPHLPDLAWLKMADSATPADKGRFFLQGRSDRIVKLEEKRISLDVIEQRLCSSPLVLQAHTLVSEGPGTRQRIAAFIVLSEEGRHILAAKGKIALNQSLRDVLADTVEPVALPRRWRYPDALPVNTQGKISHAALLALLDPPARPTEPHYIVLKQEAQHLLMQLSIAADLHYFDGHFQNAPVLPGVAQVEWAILYAQHHFAMPPLFTGMQALKFQRVIRPGDTVMLQLDYDPLKSVLSFRFYTGDAPHSSGRISFGASS
ncbi:AMP-binding protein [Herbaspirillum sp. RTI4]|uniref:AMP-binding protein n=1 Tax=Herbaspirillum sp. RTI4 TaxID=3048640 RepID=UPI002AB47DB9|nr:AMP-binding protein [Herbaspirillum sp. RTI4]MDY7578931.1 AMP-binding protein [Herbaspirillum sp. RTI4]MEA9982020.1 AMP-binding protein [Herbaspirillum sp. RTI4]